MSKSKQQQSQPSDSDRLSVRRYRKTCKRTISEIGKIGDILSLDPGLVHALRIDLKKILGIEELLLTTKNFRKADKRCFHPYRRLFKHLGRLRGAQVEFQVVEGVFPDYDGVQYLHDLHHAKLEAGNRMMKYLRNRPIKQLHRCGKKIMRCVNDLQRRTLRAYFEDQRKYLEKVADKYIFHEQRLHEIRWSLKQYCLNLKNAGGRVPGEWTKLLDLFGQWHDMQVAYDHIIKALSGNSLSEHDRGPLFAAKEKILQQKDERFRAIAGAYSLIRYKVKENGREQMAVSH